VEPIRSKQNPTYLALAKLIGAVRMQREQGVCVLEGEHLIGQFVARHGPVQTLIHAATNTLPFSAETEVVLAPGLLAALSSLATAPDHIAIARVPAQPPRAAAANVVVLDGVQDPGNLGTLLRTAAAAGVDEAWCGLGCAYAWSTKVLRASQGAQFGLVIREALDLPAELATFTGNVVVTTLSNASDLYATRLTVPSAFVFGNEGAGVSADVRARATQRVNIPMAQGTESLNVSAAAAVVLFEWRRQCAAV
jgi:RNA methyltransferase, TrmH family